MCEPIPLIKDKIKLKLKHPVALPFKEFVYRKIISSVGIQMENGCTHWLGYKKNCGHYSVACHIVHFKNGRKHFLDPQKYIFNYNNQIAIYPITQTSLTYSEIMKLKNRVRNIDSCKNRGQCCRLSHLEEY
jgi:hypothetical protein